MQVLKILEYFSEEANDNKQSILNDSKIGIISLKI